MPARIILATLNAKYIHASLGLRYLLANMERHGSPALRACAELREYTIRREPAEIAQDLVDALGQAPVRVLGLGVYIWNVIQTTEVVRLIKASEPGIKVVLGGPEVSHEWDGQDIVTLADHVITGWGDVSFPRLCQALVFGPRPLMKVIAGEQPALDALALPYAEYSTTDLAQRVLYVEASRGCPFQCEFCLSALDKTAWAFDLDKFLDALQSLVLRGARSFKFVDRTFNLKIDATRRILQFFLDHLAAQPEEPWALHFELVPDHLPDRLKEVIAKFPAGVLQFEVGIQSFNPAVQQRIARRQDNARTATNIAWLVTHSHAHLHTDLIFGLPGESWQSFAEGFDQLYALGPHEIQLGVLKRLRGTPLAKKSRSEAGERQLGEAVADVANLHYGMVYAAEPPYTVQRTDAVTDAEVQAFTRLARYWDLVANSGRFPQTLPLLMAGPSAFGAFSSFADWLWQHQQRTHGLTPEMLVDALFDYLTQAPRGCGENPLPREQVRAALLADYQASGARANPRALQGVLPHRSPQDVAGRKPLNNRGEASQFTPISKPRQDRQERHQKKPMTAAGD